MAPMDASIISATDKAKVMAALQDDRYVWRTIEGIAQEKGLSEATVEAALWDYDLNVITASEPDPKGRTLFTTREHYQKKRPFGWRVLGAIAGKIA